MGIPIMNAKMDKPDAPRPKTGPGGRIDSASNKNPIVSIAGNNHRFLVGMIFTAFRS
jgi:hypothetical protein